MKILIICPYFFEPHRWMISAYKTALNLSKKHKVIVLTAAKERVKKHNPNLTVYGMPDLFLPDPINYSFVPGLFWYLWKIIRKEKPDYYIVSKFMFFTSFSAILLKILGKKVITITDTFPGINWMPRNPIVKVVMWIYARVIGIPLLKISDKVILLHEGLIDVAKKYNLKWEVIHNGVELEKISKAEPSGLVKKNTKVKVAYIGRLESIKGYETLLSAANSTFLPRFNNQSIVKILSIANEIAR